MEPLASVVIPALLASVIAGASPGAPGDTLPSAAQADAAIYAVSAQPLGRLQVLDPVPSLFAGPAMAGSALGAVAAPAGTLAELSSARLQGGYAGRRDVSHPQRVVRRDSEPAESVAAPAPAAPSGWIALMCGFVVVAFVARRKLMLTLS